MRDLAFKRAIFASPRTSYQLVCTFVHFSLDLDLVSLYNLSMDFLQRAKADRERLLKKLAALDESIAILDPVYGENWEDNVPDWALGAAELGLTDSVRLVLQSTASALSPLDVRERLIKSGYSFGDQPNPLASIHTVLKRITNGTDPRFARVEGEKGALYKFNGVSLAAAQEIYTQSHQVANELAIGRYRSGEGLNLAG